MRGPMCIKFENELYPKLVTNRAAISCALIMNFEDAILRCAISVVFKLYGQVNSVKNTTINIWLNDGVY